MFTEFIVFTKFKIYLLYLFIFSSQDTLIYCTYEEPWSEKPARELTFIH